jgi:hypothetical protein
LRLLKQTVLESILSIIFFGFGATGLFSQLQSALNDSLPLAFPVPRHRMTSWRSTNNLNAAPPEVDSKSSDD